MIDTRGEDHKAEEESFEVIQVSDSEDNKNEKAFENLNQRDLELEILSNIDPNDEFLQSERSFSLIDGVSDVSSDFSVISKKSSDFSIISGSQMHKVLNASLSLP